MKLIKEYIEFCNRRKKRTKLTKAHFQMFSYDPNNMLNK